MVVAGGVMRERRRRREFASDRRAGRWSRDEARDRLRDYAERNWWRLLLFVIPPIGVLPIVFLLPSPLWLRWLAIGVLIACTGSAIAFQVVLATGTAGQMSGDLGARCSATELRRARRDGWRVIGSVDLRGCGDIDHVAVGPGGLIAIETKWIGIVDDQRDLDRRVDKAVRQIKNTAKWLYWMFPNDVPRPAFQEVVALWGPAAREWEAPTERNGVVVLHGRDLRTWLAQRPDDLVTPASLDRVWRTLSRTVERRDAYLSSARRGSTRSSPPLR
jgi:hypothetical protein